MTSSEEPQDESEDFMKDPNLARYLQHGRRHTLGAAHNHMLLPTDQLRKLREISEVSSSQTSDALDDSVGPQEGGSFAPVIISGSSNLQGSLALSSSGVINSSQTSIPGFNIPNRPYLHVPRNRMGRRSSDAAPYAAAYRLFIEKRNPLLAHNGSVSMERQDSTTSRSSTSSVKMLLQEKKAFGEAYGGLPTTHHKQWIQYKNQV